MKTLQENGSKVKISGNILLLVPLQSNNLTNPESSPSMMWIWNGGYLKTASIVPGLDVTTRKVIEISALGSLVEVVNPNVVDVSSHLTGDKTSEVNTGSLTWSLRQEPLNAVVELCSALGWDLDFPRLSSYVSRARPVRSSPYYRFPESREPDSCGRPAGLTLFRF